MDNTNISGVNDHFHIPATVGDTSERPDRANGADHAARAVVTPPPAILAAASPVAPPTAADARRAIASWSDLSQTRRRGLASALSRTAEIVGQDEAALVLSCTGLNAMLFTRPPAAYGLTPQRFGNIVSDLRFSMRRLGVHAPNLRGRDALGGDWSQIIDLLPTKYRQAALAEFCAFCTLHNVAPGAVDDTTLIAYEAWLRGDTLCDDAGPQARRVASNWSWAAANVTGWPTQPLRRASMREQYTLPLDAYPASFQADVDRYAARLAGEDTEALFEDDGLGVEPAAERRSSRRRGPRGRGGPSAPRTVETRRFHLRQAAAALVLNGVQSEALLSLRDLVAPIERCRAIIGFFFKRANKTPTTQTAGIAETLRQIARYHCRLPEADLALLAKWAERVTPEPKGTMSDKNMRRLRAMLEPRNRAKLLHLPEELVCQAQEPGQTPKAAARLVAYAVALEILLVFPMRRDNLAKLRLDQHLVRLTPGARRVSHIFLAASEVKNRQEMHWPVPAESADLIRLYVEHHRPHIAAPGNPYLFVGPGLVSRSPHELAVGLSELIARNIGIPVHLHLLRHFAVALYLEANPGAYEVARQILGHKRVSTTIAFYAGLEADTAAKHFDSNVLDARAKSRKVARAAYRKPKRRRATPPNGDR